MEIVNGPLSGHVNRKGCVSGCECKQSNGFHSICHVRGGVLKIYRMEGRKKKREKWKREPAGGVLFFWHLRKVSLGVWGNGYPYCILCQQCLLLNEGIQGYRDTRIQV